MTTGNRLPRPLLYFAIALSCACILGICLLYRVITDPSFDLEFRYFLIITLSVHLLVMVGIISKRHWGLLLFKAYLYLMYLAIPIGTYIAYKTLQYINSERIDELYR